MRAPRPMNHRPDPLAHIILALGVILFALPVWLVFAGSTQDSDAIMRGELSLLPHLANLSAYPRVLSHGTMGTQPVWHMLLVSFGMALAIAFGKIIISVLSAYAVVFFRLPFRHVAFWLIFVTLMLPVEVRIIPCRDGECPPDQQLPRLVAAADRLRHRDAAVPPGVHRHSRRTGRGRPHRRRRPAALPARH